MADVNTSTLNTWLAYVVCGCNLAEMAFRELGLWGFSAGEGLTIPGTVIFWDLFAAAFAAM